MTGVAPPLVVTVTLAVPPPGRVTVWVCVLDSPGAGGAEGAENGQAEQAGGEGSGFHNELLALQGGFPARKGSRFP